MKNINELIGLINGINFDGVINQKETDRLQSWVDRSRNVYCNIENSTQLWDEFVVGFKEYKETELYKHLWNDFLNKIEEQYE